MPGDAATRHLNFSRNHPAWIVVRHFLSADLLEELCDAVVARASLGRLVLPDLFDTVRTGGPPALAAWAVRSRSQDQEFARRLQEIVRHLVWQDDSWMGLFGTDLTVEEAKRLGPLDQALKTSSMTLGSVAEAARLLTTEVDTLQPILQAVVDLGGKSGEPGELALRAIGKSLVDAFDHPLGALVVKHLGDLHALADGWVEARALYNQAAELLAAPAGPEWSNLVVALRAIVTQSSASAEGYLGASDMALASLDGLAQSGQLADDAVALANCAADVINLSFSIVPGRPRYDGRTSLVMAPQLLDALDDTAAYAHLVGNDQAGAQRLFWAALRRQVALGSTTYSRHTRAVLGRSLIDACRKGLPRREYPDRFGWGVQMLIEGEHPDVVDLVSWTEHLVAAYVDDEGIHKAQACAAHIPGSRRRRQTVVAALFSHWIVELAPGEVEAARSMLLYLCDAARESPPPTPFMDDLPERAFECLAGVGKGRPEFRSLAAAHVAQSILAGLENGMGLATKALEAALSFKDAFDDASMKEMVAGVATLLERLGPSRAPWTVARPAMEFLGTEPVRSHTFADEGTRDRVRRLLVRFALESETEHGSLTYYLRDLSPEWIRDNVDASAVAEVVSQLRRRAAQINSSRSADDIFSLLVAPGVSGRAGVADALESLLAIMTAAVAGRPGIPFARASRAIMLVGDAGASLAEKSGLPSAEFDAFRGRILDLLLKLWGTASQNPSVFAPFSFVADTAAPLPAAVHNWTFASVGFALSLGREKEMNEVLDLAGRQRSLHGPMSVARSIRAPDEDPRLLDVDAVGTEERGAFYAALGRRLMVLGRLEPGVRRLLVQALLGRTFSLGPRGMDAGVLAAAAAYDIRATKDDGQAAAYRRRMENDTELRLNLAPMLDRLLEAGTEPTGGL